MLGFSGIKKRIASICLDILKFFLAKEVGFRQRDNVQADRKRGLVLVYFSDELVSFCLETPAGNLSLGQSHGLLLELPNLHVDSARTEMTVVRNTASKTRVLSLQADAGGFRCRLVRLAFHLNAQLSSVLDVKRDLKVSRSNTAIELEQISPATKLGQWPEKYTTSISLHIRHILELLAREQAAVSFDFQAPLLSFIVPVFNAKQGHLDDILRSFRLQPTSAVELILSDDKSTSQETIAWLEAHGSEPNVVIVRNRSQSGISGATNAGLSVARGEWVSFLDHDDALLPFSVGEIIRAIRSNPDCAFFYTDEIITDDDLTPTAYFLKPAWDQILLSGVNYINHLSIYRRDMVLKLGGLRPDFDGSQDYDLVLRYTSNLKPHEIMHIPVPAYLWRRSSVTYSVRFLEKATRNARKALSERFGSGHTVVVDGAVDPNLHRVRFDLARANWPKVSIVIPSRDAPDLIRSLLNDLFEKTDYPAFDVIIIDNGTTDPKTLEIYRDYGTRSNFRALVEAAPFNFSAAVNKGIQQSTCDLILLLNNDVEVTSPGWLKEMVSCFEYDDVGVVGAKLLYPSGTLQHAGVIAGLGQLAGHWFIGDDANFPGPMGRLWVRQTYSCVTGAVMLVSRKCIDAVGNFDEVNFAVAYNDIDFCLRATNAGFRVAWTPFAELIHHESASRGSDETPANIERFNREKANLTRIHNTDVLVDRAYSPWFCRMYSQPRYLYRETLPQAR